MRSSRLFKLLPVALPLAIGSAGCGETQRQNDPFHVVGEPNPGAAGQVTTTSWGGSPGGGGSAGLSPTPPSIDSPLTQVVKSTGCGTAFVGTSGARVSIFTSGVKDANCADHLDGQPVCGAWSGPREYYVNLPAQYDENKAYPLIFEGPGCGGNGTDIYPIPAIAGESIRIGLTPGPNVLGHGTNEKQGCFDDKEGDDSVDWVFYENVYDKLNSEVCFDRNRVFVSGTSSGAWLANELACKYAGDALRPVRGVMPRGGGLPTEAAFVPTCSTTPLAGMWVHQVLDGTTPFSNALVAIERAMSLAQCASGHDFQTAPMVNFPIGGNNPDDTCRRITGCDPLYPLVVCPLPGANRGGNDNVVNPGWPIFVKLFEAPPLLAE
jgi:polyhydroxybutyrate depolymerase